MAHRGSVIWYAQFKNMDTIRETNEEKINRQTYASNYKVSKLLLMWKLHSIVWNLQGVVDNWDHVYFVHPSTDISTDSRLMYRSIYRPSVDRYVSRHIGWVSVDMSTEMCRSIYRPTYRSSIGRYVDWHSADMSADMLTESGCPIVSRHVDR